MSGYNIGSTVIIHKDRFSYCAHPSVTVLDNGEWLTAFRFMLRREKILHAHPQDHIFITRTLDRGVTWDEPDYAPDLD